MVSGFLTSPCDHSRIFSGLASEIRIAEKVSGSFGFSKKEKMSFTVFPPVELQSTRSDSSTTSPVRSRGRPTATRRVDRRNCRGREELVGGAGHAALDELHVQAQG